MVVKLSSAAQCEADSADADDIFYVAEALVRPEMIQNKCRSPGNFAGG
ncbi:MAG: hypothetical protein GY820_21295 [Gammaproteobacteria bacterium]|nr:hypothetical protein [Gammaproteobacteria bacterium]